MKKVIITGGTGYIGSHTVVELIKAGYSAIIIDDLSNSDISMLDRIKEITGERPVFIQLDLKKKEALYTALAHHKDAVGIIHFAAFKAVGESVEKPLEYYDNNINGLINTLNTGSENGISNFVFSSSCTVYGEVKNLPVTEDTPMGYTPSPYGATKQMCERIIEDFTSSSALKAISLRYFNPIGAHSSGIIGELPSGRPNNLMPYITQTAAGIREYLSVFGSDYDTPDGTGIRDYIHVVDVARAHVKALEHTIRQKESHLKINIGTGHGSSVLQVIRSFEKVTGLQLNYKIVERRSGDIGSIFADVSMSKKVLKWEAEFSLDDMTRSAWLWEKKLRNIK